MVQTLAEFSALAWVALLAAALLVGFSKTVAPGIATISVALFAMVLPAKASTAALLLLLIVGDMYALSIYRRKADWKAVLRMLPVVAVGMIAGAFFLVVANDLWAKRVIAAVLLVMVGLNFYKKFWPKPQSTAQRQSRKESRSSRPARVIYGSLAGFTTMVANAAGPVMSLYFLAARYDVRAFLGTAAWFFAIVNISKVPFLASIGLITPNSLLLDLTLVPAVLIGAVVGQLLAKRITQGAFEIVVLAGATLGAVSLLF